MEETFTKEETDLHYKTVYSYSGQRANNELWARAFRFYNQKNPAKQLGRGCAPCYSKVLLFIYYSNAQQTN